MILPFRLGSGLGAVGLVAAVSGASSVLMCDYDPDVLKFAKLGATENGVAEKVWATLIAIRSRSCKLPAD